MARYLVIGGVAAGASFAAKMRRLDEHAEIIMFEQGSYVSYANCGLPYYIGNIIAPREELILHTPATLKKRYNIDVLINTEVISIDKEKKTVTAKNLIDNDVKEYSYDKLMFAPGAYAIKPNMPGIDLPEVFLAKSIQDVFKLKDFIDKQKPKSVAVVGGGFIGIEMAENLHALGMKVSIVEAKNQVMTPYDHEMATILHNHLEKHSVDLYLANGLKAIKKQDEKIVLELSEGSLTVDFVVLAIGVKPLAELAQKAGLEIGVTGGVKTNQYMQTSDKDIYAAGDVVEVVHKITKAPTLLALAGVANKQARMAAFHVAGIDRPFGEVIGTSIVKVFDLTAAATGANESQLKIAKIDYDKVYLHPANHAGYYPKPSILNIKLLFNKQDGKILGGQIIGESGVDKRIDVLATAIKEDLNVYDLGNLELAYAPPYGSTRDPINYAGDIAAEVLSGGMKQVFWDSYESIDYNKVFLIDARTPEEFAKGSVDKAVNIPLAQIRQRLDEIPKDKEIYIFCQSGLRSYLASRVLKQYGLNVSNLSGGYLSFYEMVKKQEKRKL